MSLKNTLRTLFSPLLNIFESGTEAYNYKRSHRYILLFLGAIFSALSSLVFWLSQGEESGYLIPVIVFGLAGFISLLIGLIGNDRAVAKIWGGSRKQ